MDNVEDNLSNSREEQKSVKSKKPTKAGKSSHEKENEITLNITNKTPTNENKILIQLEENLDNDLLSQVSQVENESNETSNHRDRSMVADTVEKNPEVNRSIQKSLRDEMGETRVLTNILVIGDEFAKNIAPSLYKLVDNTKFSVKGIVKPNADFVEIAKSLFSNTLEYGQNDFVMLMFSTSNVYNLKSLKYAIKVLLPIAKTTNLVILPKCVINGDEKIISILRQAIRRYCSKNNASINLIESVTNIRSILNTVVKDYVFQKQVNKAQILLKTIKTTNPSSCNQSLQFFRIK